MAAAEYFSNAPLGQSTAQPYQQQSQTPTSYPAQHQQTPPINIHRPPPPNYQPNNSQPNVHFAPTPVELPQRHSFSGQQRPNVSPQNGWNNSPHNNPYQQQNTALQSRPPPQYSSSPQYGSPYSTGSTSPYQRPQHLAPHMRPYTNPNSSQYSLDHGYASDPEPRRHRKHKQRERAVSDDKRSGKSRSKNTDGLLGAAGGGLIGDLIFPGLGTVGGAALGYIGGRDYGKHRKDREQNLAAEQRDWEAKHRPHLHDRDRGRDHRSRDTSRQDRDRDRDRPRSYERRKSDY